MAVLLTKGIINLLGLAGLGMFVGSFSCVCLLKLD